MTKHSMKLGFLTLVARSIVGCSGAPDDLATETQAFDTAPLIARPTAIDFGVVVSGSTVTRSVTLLNNGRAVLDITDVTSNTTFPPDPCRAVVIQPCIRPGETTTLEVTCAPTTAGVFGGRVALRYRSGVDDLVLSIPVSGLTVLGR